MTRPRCAAFLAMSLDGFIARPDGRVDWLDAYPAPPEDYAAFFAGVDRLLVGRATYDLVATFPEWPYGTKRVYVLTHRPPAPRHGEVFLAGEPARTGRPVPTPAFFRSSSTSTWDRMKGELS